MLFAPDIVNDKRVPARAVGEKMLISIEISELCFFRDIKLLFLGALQTADRLTLARPVMF